MKGAEKHKQHSKEEMGRIGPFLFLIAGLSNFECVSGPSECTLCGSLVAGLQTCGLSSVWLSDLLSYCLVIPAWSLLAFLKCACLQRKLI